MGTKVVGKGEQQTQTSDQTVEVRIRWMIRRDMPKVLEIERRCFKHPWCEEDFRQHLQQRNCIGMVAETDKGVVGFMVYELCKTKIHLLALSVDPLFRHQDVGTQMVEQLISKLSPDRRPILEFLISETNLGGQLFLKAMGFRAKKVLRGYYTVAGQDAYVMVFDMRLIDPAIPQPIRDRMMGNIHRL